MIFISVIQLLEILIIHFLICHIFRLNITFSWTCQTSLTPPCAVIVVRTQRGQTDQISAWSGLMGASPQLSTGLFLSSTFSSSLISESFCVFLFHSLCYSRPLQTHMPFHLWLQCHSPRRQRSLPPRPGGVLSHSGPFWPGVYKQV